MGKHKSRHHNRDQRRDAFLPNKAGARSRVPWNWMLILAGLGFLAVVLYVSIAVPVPSETVLARTEAGSLPTGQDLRLATSLFNDGKARFYRYTTATGREIRFFVLRSSDGVVRAAFDACDVCYEKRRGYHQRGDVMICNNCGRSFRSVNVNVITGGCNPGPLERTLTSDQVVIAAASIEAGANYF